MKNKDKDTQMLLNLQSEVADCLACDREVIQVDESLFNEKTVQKKAWARKGESIRPLLMLHYKPCLEVCAAISNKRGLIHTQFRPKSMKSLDILTFMEGLI